MEKNIEQLIIKSNELRIKLEHFFQNYYNFENILLNIISQNYNLYKDGKDTNDLNLLTSPKLMINILYYYNYEHSECLEYLKNKYKDNKLWQELKEIAKGLNPYNLTYIIERVKIAFDNYFTSLKLYEQNPSLFQEIPKPPNTNKSKLENYVIELDKYGALSFVRLEKENLIGINLTDRMVYIHVDKRQAKMLTKIDRLYSAKLIYKNGDLSLQISYLKKSDQTENKQIKNETENEIKNEIKNVQVKYAGIDLGIRNLMAVFIDDTTTESLLIDGKPFKDYNEIESLVEQFYKIAKCLSEYLRLYGVTDLFISKQLANHKIAQIKFERLIEAIKYNAQECGIRVHDDIDESFTSKVSCISGDIKKAQNTHRLTNVSNGKRGKSTFHDKVINERFNADLNAAVNHIKVGTGKSFEWLKDKLFKLKKPIKIKGSEEFCKLIEKLKSSKEVKTNET